jgi:hypothetical protein
MKAKGQHFGDGAEGPTALRSVRGLQAESHPAFNSGSAAVLMRLIAEWIPECAAPTDAAGYPCSRGAEACMARLEFAVRLVLEQYLDEASVLGALATYVEGLATGFSDHAPTEHDVRRHPPANQGLIEMCCASLREEMRRIGQSHGQLARSWSSSQGAVSRSYGTGH